MGIWSACVCLSSKWFFFLCLSFSPRVVGRLVLFPGTHRVPQRERGHQGAPKLAKQGSSSPSRKTPQSNHANHDKTRDHQSQPPPIPSLFISAFYLSRPLLTVTTSA